MIATALGLLLLLLAAGLPVAAALGVLALLLDELFAPVPLTLAAGEIAWNTGKDFLLVAIPLFVLLGEILLRAGVAERMYAALSLWLSWLPGGLMHANIGACALFAATSGSSVATAATVGTVALPQARTFGYDEKLFAGSLAAGGTLGILIPPSINIILYAVLTDSSIPRLYLAALVPGVLLALAFMLVVAIAAGLRSERTGRVETATLRARLLALLDLLPPLFIFFLVVGSIYLGWATPTEAASLGVLGALLLAALGGRLSLAMLGEALESTIKTSTMILSVVIAAAILNFVLSAIGLTRQLTDAITQLGLSPWAMFLAMVLFYLVLGCFMETLSMMITTVPVVVPVMVALGFDPIWLGVVIIVLVEAALITPPVGLNLFVVQSLRPEGRIEEVITGVLPFLLAMLALIGLLALVPDLALWLPRQVMG
ncbi:MAG: membrane protein [Geminicoccaceae bacterium]|nr:MAG: membrane protein [Geminicoccaceae bacterium]